MRRDAGGDGTSGREREYARSAELNTAYSGAHLL
jgi:hypothetical protein